MAHYEFRYFSAGATDPTVDRVDCDSEGEARARGASELLRMPHRDAVEVWRGVVMIYSRRRGISAAIT